MLRYNVEENILEAFRVPYRKKDYHYQDSDMYTSYQTYIRGQVINDLQEVFMPVLNATLLTSKHNAKKSKELATSTYPLALTDFVIEKHSSFNGYTEYQVLAALQGEGIIGKTNRFCLLRIPEMDRFGVVYRKGKAWALLRELVQGNEIVVDGPSLKIITAGSCFVNMIFNNTKSHKNTMKFGNKYFNRVQVCLALAEDEGLDVHEVATQLKYLTIYSEDEARALRKLGTMMLTEKECVSLKAFEKYGHAELLREGFIDALKSPAYSFEKVRARVNEALSIDRAVGYHLMKDIELPNGDVIPVGTYVDEHLIKVLKYNKINSLVVIDVPNKVGTFLAENISLQCLRRGTKVLDVIRPFVDADEGDYLCRDYDFTGSPKILPMGTEITEGFLEMLSHNGILDYVLVKDNRTDENANVVPLCRLIMGNRHLKMSDISNTQDDTWVYIEEDGSVSPAKTSLCAYDVFAMITLAEQLAIGKDLQMVADGDLGLRKKVNLTAETFRKALTRASVTYIGKKRNPLKTIYRTGDMSKLNDPDEMGKLFYGLTDTWWRTMYEDMKLIRILDRTNPAAFQSMLDKVCGIVKDKHAIKDNQHSMSMGHYGRLCPYEIPAGASMGLTNNKAIGCKIEDNVMKTCYHPVRHIGSRTFIQFDTVEWMDVHQEEQYRIADLTSLDFNQETGEVFNKNRVLARVPSRDSLEKVALTYIDPGIIDYVNVDPNQTNGIVATTIPFQGANDSARVSFGLGMCKQAKGLLNPEVPLVMTSAFDDIIRMNQYYAIHAEEDGEVVSNSNGIAVINYDSGWTGTYTYETQTFSKDALIVRAPLVTSGRVKAGEIVVGSNFIRDNKLAMGANCLVVYVPKGYNYEDGVYGSRRLSSKLASYGTKVEVKPISRKQRDIQLERFDSTTYISKDRYAYRYIYNNSNRRGLKDIVKAKKLKGFIVKLEAMVDHGSSRVSGIAAHAVSVNRLQQGDKIANRHGNKGVVPTLRPNSDMLQFSNGEFVDLVYNPLGVGSRMNIGQVLECNAGFAAYILGIRIRSDSFNGMSTEEVKTLLQYTWDLANTADMEAVFRNPKYAMIPVELHDHCRRRITLIRNWAGCFNPDGTARMYDPITSRYLETDALVGVNYVYKLIHESAKKEQARGGYATERYVEKTSSPTEGLEKQGGQRMGYMELEALAAYGAVELQHEYLNERGDNPVARNNLTVSVLHKHDAFKVDDRYGMRRSVEQFVTDLEALGIVTDFEGELPNNDKESCIQRKAYRSSVLCKAETAIKDKVAADPTNIDAAMATLSASVKRAAPKRYVEVHTEVEKEQEETIETLLQTDEAVVEAAEDLIRAYESDVEEKKINVGEGSMLDALNMIKGSL